MVVGNIIQELDTVVIGSGPGGYVAAIRAAQLGKKVAIVERDELGGVCLNVGCIPSKALIHVGHRYQETMDGKALGIHAEHVTLDFVQAQKWKNETVVRTLTKGIEALLKKNKVEIIRGTALFHDTHQLRVMGQEDTSYSFKHAIVATGSRPIAIKGFPFGKRVLDSTAALNLSAVPKKLIVIGGGYIGSELAGAYANLGTEVTILEGLPHILPQFDREMVKPVLQSFQAKKVNVITNAFAKSAQEIEDGIRVNYEVDGKEAAVEADYVLVTVGRRPNTDELELDMAGVDMDERGYIHVDNQGRTSQPHIFAIGDIVKGLALAHKASYEAKVAAAAIAGEPTINDYSVIPAICFTDPELASVGYTEGEAKEKGIATNVVKFPFGANGRALSMNQTEGFVRLVSEKETGLLLGAQIVGAGASDLIGELGLAIEARMMVEDLSLTMHAHPTLAESIMDAAELAQGLPIHM